MSGRRLLLLAILLLGLRDQAPRALDPCQLEIRSRQWRVALTRCVLQAAIDGDARTAVSAANAAYYAGEYHNAVRLSEAAFGSRDLSSTGDAHFIAGAAHLASGDLATARAALSVAFAYHGLLGTPVLVVRDLHQLSVLSMTFAELDRASRVVLLARDLARHTGQLQYEADMALAYAHVLRNLGHPQAAERSLLGIDPSSLGLASRAWFYLKRGQIYLELPQLRLAARDDLYGALAAELASGLARHDLLQAIHLNLGDVERKRGDVPAALRHLELARRYGTDPMSYFLNRGLAHGDAGRFVEAAADLDAALSYRPTGHWRWWARFQRGVVASRQGDATGAIRWFDASMDALDELAAEAGYWGPTVVATNREPFLHLFGLYAQQQRWLDALGVVARLDAVSLLVPEDPRARRRAGGRLVEMVGLLDAWRERIVVVIVPARDRVWRLDVRDGRVRGSDVGDAGELAGLAGDLANDPADTRAGRALGEALLPGDVPDGRQVELLVVGAIARAPLGALRVGEHPASARWRVVRVPGILPRRRAEGMPGRLGSIAIGNPSSNVDGRALPLSGQHAREVAEAMHGRALLESKATRAAFFGAFDAVLLHVAAHTEQSFDGAFVQLHDGPAGAAEIAAAPRAPATVVLVSCGGAIGRDDQGNGSIANAFLNAGSDAVVATRWPIQDGEATRTMQAFYARGGGREPVEALGNVQRDPPMNVSAITWAAFEVHVARPYAR